MNKGVVKYLTLKTLQTFRVLKSSVPNKCYTSEEFDKLKNQITIVKEAVEEGMEI